MTLAPGARLGTYEVVSAIGAGGMGEVFRARDTALNRDVAIKVLPAALAADSERLARFKREARVLASLNHPAAYMSPEQARQEGGQARGHLGLRRGAFRNADRRSPVCGRDGERRSRRRADPPEQAQDVLTFPVALPGGRLVLMRSGQGRQALVIQSLQTGERKVLLQDAKGVRFVGGSVVWRDKDRLVAAPLDEDRLAFSGNPVGLTVEGLPRTGVAMDISASGSLVFLRPSATPSAAEPAIGKPAEAKGRLLWVDRAGKRTSAAESDSLYISEPRLSPDESRTIVDGAGDRAMPRAMSDVWTVDLRRGSLSRLSFSNGEDETGVWSPDGAWIAWASSRSGQGRALYRRHSDGSGREEKIWESGALHFHANAWTRDGQGILVTVDNPKTGFDIYLIALGPTPSARPLLADPFNETSVRISPDGRWIVYASDASGRREIYAQAFPDLGHKIQISVDGGVEPVWHPSGGEITYRATAAMNFMSVTVKVGETLEPAEPRVLSSDAGLVRGDLDHTVYAVARDGRVLAVEDRQTNDGRDLAFILGWA